MSDIDVVFIAPDPSAGHGLRSARRTIVFAPDVEYRIAYNPTEFIEESIQEVYKTLFEAVGLVVIVILVFL
ncbi:efflux RND transporter permease subunit, partial [Methylobacterium sp. WL122]